MTAERTFLEELGGGCTFPVAAFAQWRGSSPGGEFVSEGPSCFGTEGNGLP